MARRIVHEAEVRPKSPPARTPEARENQMIALAVDLAEKQLREGSASSQVITHYLKLGSPVEKVRAEILQREKYLIEAKTDQIKSQKKTEEMYIHALKAMKSYSGDPTREDYEDENIL